MRSRADETTPATDGGQHGADLFIPPERYGGAGPMPLPLLTAAALLGFVSAVVAPAGWLAGRASPIRSLQRSRRLCCCISNKRVACIVFIRQFLFMVQTTKTSHDDSDCFVGGTRPEGPAMQNPDSFMTRQTVTNWQFVSSMVTSSIRVPVLGLYLEMILNSNTP